MLKSRNDRYNRSNLISNIVPQHPKKNITLLCSLILEAGYFSGSSQYWRSSVCWEQHNKGHLVGDNLASFVAVAVYSLIEYTKWELDLFLQNSKYLRNLLSRKLTYIHNMYFVCQCFIAINAREGRLYAQLTCGKKYFLARFMMVEFIRNWPCGKKYFLASFVGVVFIRN